MPKPMKTGEILAFPKAALKHAKTPNFDPKKKAKEAHYNARARCTKPDHPSFKDYGAKGTKYLFATYHDLIAEVGLPETKAVELDRLDPNSHYEVGNVRWVNKAVQTANKKKSKTGSLPTLDQLIAKAEAVSAQPLRRKKVAFAWNITVAAIGRGYFTEGDVDRLRYAGVASECFDAAWEDGFHPDHCYDPSWFRIPSLSDPDQSIRLRSRPFQAFPNRPPHEGARNLAPIPLVFNLPKEVLSWINEAINDKAKAGGALVGQSSPAIREAGGVDGWMLACASRHRHNELSTIYPASILVRDIADAGTAWRDNLGRPLDARFLYIPDVQVDVETGYGLPFKDEMRLMNLLIERRNRGLKTVVGVQNPYRLSPPLQQEVFGHLRVLTLDQIDILAHNKVTPPPPHGTMVGMLPGRLGLRGVMAALGTPETQCN